MAKKTGICPHCQEKVTLEQIRKERCDICSEAISPWNTGYAGDLHREV